jgi:ketosteroid isomerase-like protein
MSASNVELLAEAFAGWGKDNPANMRDVLHPDCELVVPDSIPYGGTFRGADAVVGWFTRELWRSYDEFKFSEGKLTRGRVYADTAFLRDAVEGATPA